MRKNLKKGSVFLKKIGCKLMIFFNKNLTIHFLNEGNILFFVFEKTDIFLDACVCVCLHMENLQFLTGNTVATYAIEIFPV